MRFLLTISLALWLTCAGAQGVRILIQSSPLAGSQYYALGPHWTEIRVGDPLTLVREADNRFDRHAIRVEWRGHKLGYVPRSENRALAAALEQGDHIVVRISRLTDHPDPWRRVEFEVFAEL